MPSLVIDRSLVVPAACSGKSKYRALFVLLEYGRRSLYARFGQEEKDLRLGHPRARWGGPPIDAVVQQAADAKARLEEQLGHAPDEWHMTGSRLLLDTYQDAIRDNADRFGLDLAPEEVVAARQKLATTCAAFVEDERLLPLFPFTADRPTNIALMTAAIGGAQYFVTEARELQRSFEHPEAGEPVLGVSFDDLSDEIAGATFDLGTVSPGLW